MQTFGSIVKYVDRLTLLLLLLIKVDATLTQCKYFKKSIC